MKERSAEGIPGRPEWDYIGEEHEKTLWEKGILGEDNPDKLRKTIFFLVGVWFGLRGLKEQHDLRRYPDSQINSVKIDEKMHLSTENFKVEQGRVVFQIMARLIQGSHMHISYVVVYDLDALLNCSENTSLRSSWKL